MAKDGDTFICEKCGQEVVVVQGGRGTLVCCDLPMSLDSEGEERQRRRRRRRREGEYEERPWIDG